MTRWKWVEPGAIWWLSMLYDTVLTSAYMVISFLTLIPKVTCALCYLVPAWMFAICSDRRRPREWRSICSYSLRDGSFMSLLLFERLMAWENDLNLTEWSLGAGWEFASWLLWVTLWISLVHANRSFTYIHCTWIRQTWTKRRYAMAINSKLPLYGIGKIYRG